MPARVRIGLPVQEKIRIKFADHEEVLNAREAYYLAPSNNVITDEDCEILEFSPKGEYQKTKEVANCNMAVMEQGK